MSEPFLSIFNNHHASCGDPPISSNRDCYVGYFQNAFGEQWIFTFDRARQVGSLRGGDTGWNSEFVVEHGVPKGVMLNREETIWLKACWTAVTR